MAARLKDMVSDVRTHLSGAPERTCKHYLRRAAQQFCQDSHKWVQSLGTVTLDRLGTRDIYRLEFPGDDFTIPDGARLISLDRATLNDEIVEDIQWVELDSELIVCPETKGGGEFKLWGIFEPDEDSETVPDAIGRHRKAISDHAIWEMGMMPNTQWSMTATQAGVFYRSYRARLAEATVDKARKGANRVIRVAPPPFV